MKFVEISFEVQELTDFHFNINLAISRLETLHNTEFEEKILISLKKLVDGFEKILTNAMDY